ncbi:MAG: S8 family peptidase [Pseudonocardiaceae bacterium]
MGALSPTAIAGADPGNGHVNGKEGVVRATDSKRAIEDSYIVVFKDNVSANEVDSKSRGKSARHGGEVKRTYKAALRGYAAKMNERQAERVASDPDVAYVEQDQVVRATGDQLNPPSWGLDRIDQRGLPLDDKYSYSTTATNVDAYIIDTGIRTTHNDFSGRAQHGIDTVDNDSDATDCNGHGTHVAGTVGGSSYGVAKGVTLIAVRVLNCEGSGSNAGVIAGIDWVTQNAQGPSVANMSLGGGASSALDDAVRQSISAGVSYAVASGNSNEDACFSSPARVGEALTVNSADSNDSRSSFSNYGTCTDIFAPGRDITSAWIGSDSDTNTISGTSMATPHVAGAAALYLADNTSATPSQVNDAILSNATTGVVSNPGSGSPNKLLYTGSGAPIPDPEPGSCDGTNGSDVSIPDAGSAVTSSITVSGCNRKASSTSTISVDIKHTYRGDLVIDLIAPNGDVFNLKQSSGYDSADNVVGSVDRNLSSYDADGTWTLRVRDVYRYDTGYIDSWSIAL